MYRLATTHSLKNRNFRM